MAKQPKPFRTIRLVMGAVFAGLGMFIFYGNLAGELTRLTQILHANGSQFAILAAWRVFHAYSADQQHFLQSFLQHVLLSSWPLLLVMTGTAMSRDAFTEEGEPTPSKKDF